MYPVGGIIVSILVTAVCVGLALFFAFIGAVRLRLRLRLRSTITLVEFRSGKAAYIIALGALGFMIIFAVSQMFDGGGPENANLYGQFGMTRPFAVTIMGGITALCLSLVFLCGVGLMGLPAITDRGITTGGRFYWWHNLYDYHVDDKSRVTISTQRLTFLTLKGAMPPVKCAEEDVPKLKFIFNKNKNKFH